MRHGARRALPCAPRTGRREEDGPLLARWPSVARSGRVSPPPRNRPPRFGVIARAWRSGCGSCRRVRPRAAGLRHPLARTQLFELRTGLGGPTPPGRPGAHTTPPAAAAASVTTPNHGPLFIYLGDPESARGVPVYLLQELGTISPLTLRPAEVDSPRGRRAAGAPPKAGRGGYNDRGGRHVDRRWSSNVSISRRGDQAPRTSDGNARKQKP